MLQIAVVIHNGILWKFSLHLENCVNLKLGLYWIYVEVLLFVFFFFWRLILPVAKRLDHLFVFLLFQFFRKGPRNSYLFQVILIFRKMQNFFIIPQRKLSHSLNSESLSLSWAKIIGPLFLFISTRCRTFVHSQNILFVAHLQKALGLLTQLQLKLQPETKNNVWSVRESDHSLSNRKLLVVQSHFSVYL